MAHVVLVGLGTIGSHVAPHLARMSAIEAVTLVDPERYEPSNLRAQHISTADVGRSKAQSQARRLAQVNPALATRAFDRPVEDLPLGWLRADVILACLDSRRSRMVVNQAAHRLGMPWINAGVDASGLLARVQVFMPGAEAPCLECAWDAHDFELVEQTYACQDQTAAASTGASSGLGALAASLVVLECEKLLAGEHEQLLAGRDVMIDARHHRHFVTVFRRNPECRMPDHAAWDVVPLDEDPSSTTVEQFEAMVQSIPGADRGWSLGVAGQAFAMSLTCGGCGARTSAHHLYRGSHRLGSPCLECGGNRTAPGMDLYDTLTKDAIFEAARNRTLGHLGLLPGDVLSITTSDIEVHFELGGGTWPTAS